MSGKPLRADGERLWSRLMEMAKIGATEAGGCNRQALTDEDKKGRELFAAWCKEAGCSYEFDEMGNMFVRRPGSDNSLPPVVMGSHLDTQPTGGKFDGVYGVLAGLEVIESLNDKNISTTHPVDVVVWTNEEGARFSPAMIGSGVFAGEFDLEYGHSRAAKDGATIGEELKRLGFDGDRPCKPVEIKAAFEAHIEQGPILEAEALQIGVVTGVQGMRWYDINLSGDAVHAGPTPMESRRDPVMALHAIVGRLYELVESYAPWGRVTFGDIRFEPGARNTVPEKVVLALDLRHPDEDTLSEMDGRMREIVADEAGKRSIGADIRVEWESPAVKFDSDCIDAVDSAVSDLGYPSMRMVSGAGHDSVYLSRVAPASMIFVPCAGGISHNEQESAEKADLAAGCDVLLNAVVSMAGVEY